MSIRFDHGAADDLVRQLPATAQAVFEAAAVTDALREEIADDDPGDVRVAATELAAAEQNTAASVGDPALVYGPAGLVLLGVGAGRPIR